MPHGAIRVGGVEIVALCDAVVDSSGSIEASYPLVPGDAWPGIKERHPESVAPTGRWRLHVHCFLIRLSERTLLFDCGIGPVTAPAHAWAETAGNLPAELEAVGVASTGVDTVVISHLHDDHVGWNVGADGSPRFANARYLVHEADIAAVQSGDEEDREIWERTILPLGDALVTVTDGARVADGLVLSHRPGHTPGHQVLFVESERERAVLSADITNHPLLLENPGWSGTSDADPGVAARTRAELLDDVEREKLLYVTSHFEYPFGTVEANERGRRLSPMPGG